MPSLSSSALSPSATTAMMALRGQMDMATIKSAQAIKSNDPRLDAAAHDFEAMFLSEMLKPMMETVDVDERFGGGKGEEVFRGFLVQEYGKKLAAAGGIGLAQYVKEALVQAQSAQKLPGAPLKGGAQ